MTWTFSRNADRTETTSIRAPTDKEEAVKQLGLALEGGWWYTDRGFGWEHTTLVYDEVFINGLEQPATAH